MTSANPKSAASEFPLQPIEVISVLSALGLIGIHLVRFAWMPGAWSWPARAMIALALLAADFVSGVVHWIGDTWWHEQTPWLGKRFIKPFRFHHAQPLDMLKSSFFTTNGDTALASLPFLLAPFAIPLTSETGCLAAVFVCGIGAWGMWTSQFHQWAHLKSPPRPVAWLQRRGLILSPRQHWRHHKSPYAENYCITTGWCNPLLTRIRFFPALEWAVSKLTGWQPRGEPNESRA